MQAAPDLRPLGVGDIIDRVFGVYRAHLVPLFAIAGIPYLVLVLLVFAVTLPVAIVIAQLAASATEIQTTGTTTALESVLLREGVLAQLALWFLLVVAIALATSLVQSASLIVAVAGPYMGRPTSVGSALAFGLRASGRLLVMGVVAFFAFWALWIVLIVFMVVARQGWATLIGILGGLFLTGYLGASWMVAPAVATLEGAGPMASLSRSWHLSGGHRWRIIGLVLLLLLLQIVISTLLSTVLLASVGVDPVIRAVVQQGVNIIANVAWAPIYWGTFAVLYYDLRVRKEALDLQVALEALPRDT